MNFWKKGYTNVPGFVPSGYGASEWAESKNKPRSEEEYFEKGDSDEEPDSKKGRVGGGEEEEEEEDDPLEAFMMGIEQEVNTQKASKAKGTTKTTKGIRDDIEQEDDQESYFKAVANTIIVGDDADDEWDYDDEGNPIPPERSKVIDPLPPIDHSAIDYPSFEKNFYEEHSDVVQLQGARLMELRHTLGLKVSGPSPLKPCVSFAYFGFDEHLMGAIRKSEFTQPTPIQAQAIPCVLAGRDVIGIAKTGSGKTAAYLWPMLVHIMDQPELTAEDGPIGLICAPTRELCQQIYHEARKFGKVYGLRSCAVYGGVSKWEQVKALKDGAEILVATPGRLIDLVKAKATNLQRVTYLVFDEADRMFDMGFEPQVRSIANHVRPDRQTLLFSATFRKKVERLCRDTLVDPLRVVVGELGEANTDVTQHVFVFPETEDKWGWLATRLVQFTSTGSVLIFVTRKLDSEVIVERLRTRDTPAGLLHGDMDQGERDKVILGFKKGSFPVLVATDVAARGLDIPSIRTVINYDVAKNIDTHIHRIGRTGRAGEKGTAYTLVTAKDVSFAGDLVRSLEAADQEVPDSLLSLAMQSSRFRKSRYKSQSKGKGERRSFKPRQRPGLGMSEEMRNFCVNPPEIAVFSSDLVASVSPSCSLHLVAMDQVPLQHMHLRLGLPTEHSFCEKRSLPATSPTSEPHPVLPCLQRPLSKQFLRPPPSQHVHHRQTQPSSCLPLPPTWEEAKQGEEQREKADGSKQACSVFYLHFDTVQLYCGVVFYALHAHTCNC